MELKFFAATDVGRQRDHNEDNYLVDPKLHLFVVADGMGGHAAGEVASQIAVHEVSRVVRENADVIERYAKEHDQTARQEILAVMEHAVQTACASIYHRGQAEPDKRGMGTTTSALLIAGDRGFIAHVGDSRIYLLRQSQVHQLTEDHSLINELVRRGKIKRDEIDTSPYAKYKNAVTRAVGAYESVEVDTLDFEVLPGDHFLLCSDGLHAYLKDSRRPRDPRRRTTSPTRRRRWWRWPTPAAATTTSPRWWCASRARRPTEHAARASDLANRVDVLKKMPLFKHLTYKEIMRLLNVTGGQGLQAGREDHRGEDGRRGAVHHPLGQGAAAQGRGVHHAPRARARTSARWRWSIARSARRRRRPRSESRALMLRRRDFYEIIRKEPVLATKLLWSFVQVLTERLRKTTADLSGARLEAQAVDLSEDVLFEGGEDSRRTTPRKTVNN